MAIAESIVREAEFFLAESGGAQASRLTIVIGEFSGVDEEALSFALPFASEGTRLAGAEFDFEKERADAECRVCGSKQACVFPLAVCASCGSSDVEVSGGTGLVIKSMELNDV